ncbi:MAG: type II toxin-antitoxin system RelB/DinJ family antitoxin [Clostridia bacterium]|nr:type II toxin-antitoxin system RelB/DinJ family antitoxin [Clostridia bacterium]
MESNVTFRIDANVKKQMSEICKSLGMTTSTAFNLFANAFVREQGMPFPVTIQKQYTMMDNSRAKNDVDDLLDDFQEDYRRMAE